VLTQPPTASKASAAAPSSPSGNADASTDTDGAAGGDGKENSEDNGPVAARKSENVVKPVVRCAHSLVCNVNSCSYVCVLSSRYR